jgi:hypothetical protein
VRFEAELPDECWQTVEIICSSTTTPALSVTAHDRTGPSVVEQLGHTVACPSITLADDGMVFTTCLSGGRGRFSHS